MKSARTNLFLHLALAAVLGSSSGSFAATGTWTATTSGNWDDLANWSLGAGPIADGGAGSTANFTSNIGATTTVTLATARSVQNLVFSDNGASGSAWALSGSTLTLAGTTPKITTTTAATINTVIAGSAGFAKDATGTLTLTGANLYDGTTTLSVGTLNIRHNTALGNATAGTAVVSGAVLQVQDNLTCAEPLTLNGTGISSGGALANVSGSNLLTGAITLNTASRINASTGSTLTLSGAITNGASLLTVGGAGTTIISNSLGSGSGGLVKDGSGTLTLSGTCGFTGATTLSAGTLGLDYATSNTSKLADGAVLTLGGGTLSLAGGSHTEEVASTTLAAGTSSTISRSSGSAVIDLKAITAGAGATLNLTTSGIAKTSNSNNAAGVLPPAITVGGALATRDANGFITSFTGYANVNRLGGVINDNPASIVAIVEGGASGNITLGSATTTIHSLVNQATGGAATVDLATGTPTLRLGADGGITQPNTATGALAFSAGGSLTAGGAANTAGTLTLNNANTTAANRIIVNTAITDNGSGAVGLTKIGAGTVDLGSATTITGALATYGGSLNLTGTSLSYAAGSLAGSGGIAGGGNALMIGADNTSTTYSGALSGTGTALTKTGTGTLTLTASNSYTGATVINNGTLFLNTGGTSASTAASTGTLAGTASITINNGGTLEFGGSSTTNTTSGANSIGTNSKPITVNAGGTLKISSINAMGYWNANQYARITLSGGSFQVNYNQYISSLTIGTGGTVTGAGIIQLYYAPTAPDTDHITATDDATLAAGIGLDNSGTTKSFSVAAGKTLNISGKISNFAGGNSTTLLGFTKNGPGTLLLSNTTNNYSGITLVSAGTLKVGAAGALGSGSTNAGTTVTSGAVLDLNGQTVGAEALTLNGTGISAGGALINSSATPAAVGTGGITIATATSIGGSGSFSLAGAISGTTALTKTGAGTVTLSGTSSGFTGATDVNQGTLALSGGIPNSNVTVADGSTLTAVGGASGVQTGNLTLGSTTGCALSFTNLAAGNPSALSVQDLHTNGVTTVTAASALGSFEVGSYPLITASGSIGRTGTGTFALAPLPRGVSGTLADTGTALTLNITAVNLTTWKGTAGNNWDINATANWKLGVVDPDVYLNGDSVLFDGSASNTNVTLNTTVTPLTLTFEFDSPKTYTITGSGAIGGATGLWKKGSGLLTLGTANTYTGTTLIDGGTVQIGGTGTLGGGTHAAAIENYGTAFRYSSSANQTLTGVISGTGELIKDTSSSSTLTLTAANTYDGPTSILAGTLQLGGAGVIGNGNYAGTIVLDGILRCSSSSAQSLSGTISGTGSLVKDTSSASKLTIDGDNTFSGGTSLQAGTLKLGHANALGTGTVTLATAGNFLVDMNALTGAVVFDNAIALVDPATAGNLGITAPNAPGDSLELSGIISGGGTNSTLYLRNTSSGTTANTAVVYIISGNNTYTGKTYFYEGGVRINHANAFGTSAVQFDQTADTLVTFGSAMTVANAMRYTYQTKKIDTAALDIELSGTQSLEIATAFDKAGTGKLTVSGVCSGAGGIKVSEGTLRLTAANTYTGNTVVAAGSLELPDNARLTFKLGATSGTSNTLTGDGAITLEGDFAIDTTGAAGLSTGTWVLENVSTLTGAYGGNFTVVNPDGSLWTNAGSDKWTKPGTVSGTQFTFDETTGTLTLGTAGYDSWKTQIGDTAQQGRDKDPDGDGFTNLQEFLFGTLPTAADGTLVTTTTSPGSLTLRWLQREAGATYALRKSTTLAAASWTTPASPIPVLDTVQTGAPSGYKYYKVTLTTNPGSEFFRIQGVEN